jgi:hypothetical protein
MATLFQLHERIAKAFDDLGDIDWSDTTHLHEFILPKERGGVHYYDSQMFETHGYLSPLLVASGKACDDSKVTVEELSLRLGEALQYIYDFGPGWSFTLKLRKVEEAPLQV